MLAVVVQVKQKTVDTATDEDGDGFEDTDGDGVDDDACADPDCSLEPVCGGSGGGGEIGADCQDGQDNDGNGLIDCGESSCLSVIYCQNLPPEDCMDQIGQR